MVSIALLRQLTRFFSFAIIVPLYTDGKTSIVITSNQYISRSAFIIRRGVGPASISLAGLVRFSPHLPDSCRPRTTSPSHPISNFFIFTAPALLPFSSPRLGRLSSPTYIAGSGISVGGVINTPQPAPQASRGQSTPGLVEDSHELDHFDLKSSPSVRIASTPFNVD